MGDGQRDAQGAAPVAAVSAPVRLRLPRASRLSPAGYRATFDVNRSRAGRLLVIWLREDGGANRVGTVASKRALRSAVERNRARRLLREAFRLNRPHLKPGVDMVLIARARIEGATCGQVAEEFRRLCKACGVWREAS